MARYPLYPRDMLGEKCPSPFRSIPLQEGSYEGQPPPCSSSCLFTQQTLSSGLRWGPRLIASFLGFHSPESPFQSLSCFSCQVGHILLFLGLYVSQWETVVSDLNFNSNLNLGGKGCLLEHECSLFHTPPVPAALCMHARSCLTLCNPLQPFVVHQAPLPMEFPRQEYWSGLAFPPPGAISNPVIKPASPVSPALAGGFFTTEPPGKPYPQLNVKIDHTVGIKQCFPHLPVHWSHLESFKH